MNKTSTDHVDHSDETDSFYSRWSKSKLQQAKNHSELSNDCNSSLEISVEPPASSESNQEKNLLCDKDMPDIDTLDEESDYTGFLSSGVSEELRKVALRKLFQGSSFNICDGLDDYDEEFTSFEKLGDIVTADMRFQLEEEAKRKLQLAAENEDISDKTDEMVMSAEDSSEHVVTKPISASIEDDDTAEIDENELRDNENLS